jgi:Aromatic acid exporter family member 1
VAAVLSFVIAEQIGTGDVPVLAPLTTLLVLQVTMYQTVTQSLQRVASVLAGVLVAVGVAALVGLSWWSLGGVIAVSLVLGRLLRLGPQLLEVPISAMLILAVGGAPAAASARVVETLVGAGVGVVINLLLGPPLHLRPAGEALGELADRMAAFMRDQATALRPVWSRSDADHWLNEARALGREVNRADRVLAQAEEGARLHPVGARSRQRQPRLRTALTGLERCYLSLREMSRALLDRTYFVPPEEENTAYGEDVRTALAEFLESAADATATVGEIAATPTDDEHGRVSTHLAELEQRRNHLSTLLMVDPAHDPAAWEQHGALLTAVDRLRVEVESAARHPEQRFQPAPLTELKRQAVRRIIDDPRRRLRRRAPSKV